MSIISGKDAFVNGVPCTTSWSATQTAAIQPYVCSATQGGTGIVEGNINWAGSMAGLGPNPPVIPGQTFDFKGAVDATSGDSLALEGVVFIESVNIQFPVQGGGPITWSANFGVDGVLVSTTTTYVDSSAKLATSAKDVTIIIDPLGTPVIVAAVQNVTLGFAAPSVSYVDAGVVKRVSGNLSANLSFDVLNRDIFQAEFQPNTRQVVHVDIGDTTAWLLDEIVFGGTSNFNVNVATRAIVGYTVNGQWSAVSDLAVDNLGQLKSPAGVDWFGTDPPVIP